MKQCLVLFQICFFLVLYTSSIILNNLTVYLTRSEVAGDVLLLCVNLLTHSCWIVFSCVLKPEGALSVEILWGLGLMSHLQEQSWFCFFQVSRSLVLLFILTSWHRGLQDKICNVHLNPEPVWKADLQLYILRRDFPCLLVKIQAESDKLPYYLSVLLGTLFFLFHLFTQTIALWGFWPYSVCIRRYGRSRPHLLVLIWV